MSNYDFHRLLEPMEFQEFARDIVQKRDGIFLESYKEGKDQGVDGGCFNIDNTIILQAKRWKCDYRTLYRHLKNKEKDKVIKLNPDRYILGVSMDLSKENKEQIIELFSPYIVDSSDIITEKDFNNLLDDDLYKAVEKKYSKLWLPSTSILQNMLNGTVHSVLLQESIREFEEALKKSAVFVETEAYGRAMKILNEKRVVIVSGEPGMGKTSIAYQLGRFFVQRKGYEEFFWIKSVDDIYIAQRSPGKKVIIFDDFWGSTFQESSIAGKDEQRLAKIIERIKIEKNCILILTTREYILKQGLEKHAELKEVIGKYKLECRLEEYSEVEKARIFFGHLQQSKLNWQQTKELFREHKEIVRHANYNPRVIEMFLQNVELNEHPKECVEHFWDYIERPENFWNAIFNNLSSEAKLLSVILLISPVPSLIDHIKKTYYRCLKQMQRVIDKKNFAEVVDELEKTVIKSMALDDEYTIIVKFQNPSAQEYIFNYLRNNIEHYFEILSHGSCYHGQLTYLLNHYTRDSEVRYSALMKKCIDNFESMPLIPNDYREYLDSNEFEYYYDSLEETTQLVRFYSILCGYSTRMKTDFSKFFINYIENYNEQMRDIQVEIDDYNLEMIYRLVIIRYLECGLKLNGMEIIHIYFERICFENGDLDVHKFQEVFPNEYSMFLHDNRQRIQKYIEEYFEHKLSVYIELNNVNYCKFIVNQILESFNTYELPYTSEFKTIVESYMSFLNETEEELDEDQEEDFEEDAEWKAEKIAYDEVVETYTKEILGEVSYFWEEDLQDFIRGSHIDEELKYELLEIQDSEEYWYIREFMADEESFLFLEKNLLESKQIFKQPMLFISHLLAILASKTNVDQKKLISFLINFCSEVMYRENAKFTKDEIISTEAYTLNFEYDEQYLELMIEGGLFIEQGKWCKLVNILLVMIPYGMVIAGMNKDEKSDFYNSMDMADQWQKLRAKRKKEFVVEDSTYLTDIGFYYFENTEWEKLFLKLFLELDPHDYLDYYVVPTIQNYFQKIKKESHIDTASFILKELDFRLDINKQGENAGGMASMPFVWTLIESLDLGCGFDIVPYEFSEEQMNYISRQFDLVQDGTEEVYKINLGEITDVDIISKLGIDDSAIKLLDEIENNLRELIIKHTD
ncbi:hypothetical protein [Paenibacillus monticola]|uniref:Novel STAND NTPase 3 domain-containing protein n=1 Tax=Paenibacillus monticola TaxID=2666075 RepID=A0A7X2H7F4_9BACL|nr:hypothetical protein [Paenibacillus monticola]MRN54926.1 hypothetical protein [Paenibacillus monticola]